MALFSRRAKSGVRTPAPSQAEDAEASPSVSAAIEAPAPTEPANLTATPQGVATAAQAPVDPALVEPVPAVGISVSAFGGSADAARQAAPGRAAQTAPAATQEVPGLTDNVLLQVALRALPESPKSGDVMNVMRQALQGQLYVRAQGDAQALLTSGQGLNLAITTNADKRYLLVFSGGLPLQESAREEGAGQTSAVGQPVHLILRAAIDSGYDGIYLDHANPGARLVVPIELVRKAVDEGAPPPFVLKNLVAGPRNESTPAAIADALTRVPVWVAGGVDASGQIGVAEARGEGKRRLEVYSHPLEVIAMGRGDRPLPLTPEQLARMLASEPEMTGIVIDAAGPWIELDRATLAPLLAIAG